MKTVRTYTPIVLTEEQKDRMMEMCLELFPDRDWLFWADEDGTEDGTIGHHLCHTLGNEKTYKPLMCFWMEFLIYKLIPTFSKRYGPVTMTWNMKNMVNADCNMIDKFYDEFYKPWVE